MQVLIVESYGGRDEPVDTLTNNFVGVGVEPALEAIRVKEVPNEATYQVKVASVFMIHGCWHEPVEAVSRTYKQLCGCLLDAIWFFLPQHLNVTMCFRKHLAGHAARAAH